VTLDGSTTKKSYNCFFSELRIKLTCYNDNSNRPSTKSLTDKGVETNESVKGTKKRQGD